MLSKIFAASITCCILLSHWLCAQKVSPANPDTLYTYHTIIVYDTVFIHDTIWVSTAKSIEPIIPLSPFSSGLQVLQLDTLNKRANLLFVSGNRGSWIPVDRIVFAEGITSRSSAMKLNFFGVTRFAFRSMVLPRLDYGLLAGSGLWWVDCNKPSVKAHFSPMFNAGVYIKGPISKQFFVQSGLKYTFLLPNAGYKTAVDSSQMFFVGEGESASTYHQFSLPLQFGFRAGIFEPMAGIEYAYRFSEAWLSHQNHHFGITAEFNCRLSEALFLAVQYKYYLTKDYTANGSIIDPLSSGIIGKYNYFWRSSILGLTLYYSLKQNKP